MVKVCVDRFPVKWGGNHNRTPGFYMNPYLKRELDHAIKAVKKNFDMPICIDGSEGSGKSVLAMQIAAYVDPTFTVDNITFRADEFKDTILKAKKYQAVIFDEAFGGLASRRTMSTTNVALVDMMAEIRQRNLFIIIVLPSFFDLDKYAAVHRTKFLIHVYHKNFVRGFWKMYSNKKKKLLYVKGKKTYNYKAVKPNLFDQGFCNFYPVDRKAYQQKKLKNLRALGSSDEKPEDKIKTVGLDHCLLLMKKQLNLDDKFFINISTACGLNKYYLNNRLSQAQKELEAKYGVDQEIKKAGFKMPSKD